MALTPGTRLGPYEVTAQIGVGGMGEVYRATDTKLKRQVAIKILPASLAADPDRLSRFQREAEVLASLNHPNIAAVYGLEDADGIKALVMELVEGSTLADRIAQSAIPLDNALAIAKQIAEALEAAHEQWIVHRDLKPANIKVRADGTVKVLDFGLAKALQPVDATSPEPSQVSTMMTPAMTRAGIVLGTAAYMSPEQARGLAVDKRADVWAFGCVLYELLTRVRAFQGARVADTLAAVLEREPDWTRLPAETPPEIRRLLQRCLQKDLNQRLRDIGDVRLLVDDSRSQLLEPPPVAGARHGDSMWPWAAGSAVVLLAVAAFVAYSRIGSSVPGETVRMSISAPGPVTPQLSAAISPDGRHVAFVSTDAFGRALLWVRTLDSLQARPLPGSERAAHPFWSPDGRSLGFIADAQVKRTDLAGGPVQTVADTALRIGPAWGSDGTILFSRRASELMSVPASGGPVTTVVTADRAIGQTFVAWPRFLPDGRHFLYFAGSSQPAKQGIYVGSLDSKETKFVLRSDFRAMYAPPGYLVFPRDETLMAQPFDAERLELSGDATPVAEGIWFARGAAQASFSVSETGALAYMNASLWDAELAWFDRRGQPLGSLGPPNRYSTTPQVSPDGRRIAIGRGEFGRDDIWVQGTASGTLVRLTVTANGAGMPVWAGDGRRVMYRVGPRVLVKDVDTGAEETMLETSPGRVADWSRDGRFVVFERVESDVDLWVARMDDDSAPFLFQDTPFNEAQGVLSPDARWIAYTSNETGRDEVYVQSFPVPGRKRQISSDGGAMPRWREDGKELFYLAGNQFITAVPVTNQNLLEFGAQQALFRTRLVVQGSESTGLSTAYDVSPDGQRFLFRYPPADPGPPITVVLNWMGALKR